MQPGEEREVAELPVLRSANHIVPLRVRSDHEKKQSKLPGFVRKLLSIAWFPFLDRADQGGAAVWPSLFSEPDTGHEGDGGMGRLVASSV